MNSPTHPPTGRTDTPAVAFLRPRLGIGGSERLALDAATQLQRRGCRVLLFVPGRLESPQFPEITDGTVAVEEVPTSLPVHVRGRFRAPLAIGPTAAAARALARHSVVRDLVINDVAAHVVPLVKRRAGRPVVFFCHFPEMSLDGFVAGPNQSVRDPLGVGGERLHRWVTQLRVWRAAHGKDGGEVNESTRVMEEELLNIGATIMGRNMFGGHPGPWDAKKPWTGWWGANPPFHRPVFVLTHHARDPLPLNGGTTFTFVTDGIETALEQAKKAANGKDIVAGAKIKPMVKDSTEVDARQAALRGHGRTRSTSFDTTNLSETCTGCQ